MSLANVLKTSKYNDIILGRLDRYLIGEMLDRDEDRRWDVNSPSAMGTCELSLYLSRMGVKGSPDTDPRSKRILDNGSGVHHRLEEYLLKAGIAHADEIAVVYSKLNIIGHADLLVSYDEEGKVDYNFGMNRQWADIDTELFTPKLIDFKHDGFKRIAVCEIKSINSRNFATLKTAKENHQFQAMSYLLALEHERLALKKKCPTKRDLLNYINSAEFAEKVYTLYGHLQSGSKFTREDKLVKRAYDVLRRDVVLWLTEEPITSMVFLYECKDDQMIKEFEVEQDEKLTKDVVAFAQKVKAVVSGHKLKRQYMIKHKKTKLGQKELEKLLMSNPHKPDKCGTSKSSGLCAWCKYRPVCWVL